MSRDLVPVPPAAPAPPSTRRVTAEYISCKQVSCEPVWERREEWRVGEAEEAGEADPEVESASLRTYTYITLVPSALAVRRWPTCTLNASSAVLITFSMFSTLISRSPARHVMEISLEH